ncbi:hypothetical protein QQ045_013137 [Rhodiola kirilowii]
MNAKQAKKKKETKEACSGQKAIHGSKSNLNRLLQQIDQLAVQFDSSPLQNSSFSDSIELQKFLFLLQSVEPIALRSMATTGNKSINAKLVLLGDVGAGKSSLVLRFVKGQFVEFQESTIGAAFFSQTLAVNDATVKFEIWDTAGQERYHSLAPMYYRGAAAAIIVYDITNQASFDRAKKWVQELHAQGNPNMVVALAGNKADLLDARKVATEATKRLPRVQPVQNPAGMVLSKPAEGAATASCCS